MQGSRRKFHPMQNQHNRFADSSTLGQENRLLVANKEEQLRNISFNQGITSLSAGGIYLQPQLDSMSLSPLGDTLHTTRMFWNPVVLPPLTDSAPRERGLSSLLGPDPPTNSLYDDFESRNSFRTPIISPNEIWSRGYPDNRLYDSRELITDRMIWESDESWGRPVTHDNRQGELNWNERNFNPYTDSNRLSFNIKEPCSPRIGPKHVEEDQSLLLNTWTRKEILTGRAREFESVKSDGMRDSDGRGWTDNRIWSDAGTSNSKINYEIRRDQSEFENFEKIRRASERNRDLRFRSRGRIRFDNRPYLRKTSEALKENKWANRSDSCKGNGVNSGGDDSWRAETSDFDISKTNRQKNCEMNTDKSNSRDNPEIKSVNTNQADSEPEKNWTRLNNYKDNFPTSYPENLLNKESVESLSAIKNREEPGLQMQGWHLNSSPKPLLQMESLTGVKENLNLSPGTCESQTVWTEKSSTLPKNTDLRYYLQNKTEAANNLNAADYMGGWNENMVLIYPFLRTNQLFPRDISDLRAQLSERIHSLLEENIDDVQPRIERVSLVSKNWFMIQCADKQTLDWLLTWKPQLKNKPQMKICIRRAVDAVMVTHISIFLMGISDNIRDIELRITHQNEHLEPQFWKRGPHDKTSNGITVSFFLDAASFKLLSASSWQIYYELNKFKATVVRKCPITPLVYLNN